MQNNLGLENKPSILISGLLEWAERDPDRIAIGNNSNSLTFAQLLKRVELLGSKLINQQDVTKKDRVLPVLVDRRVGALIAY